MILRTGNTIRYPVQRVRVNGSNDVRFHCTSIRQGSYAGLTEAEFVVPEWAADTITDRMRDAAISVSIDGSGETHFAGYLAVDSGSLSPSDDGVILHAYSITRWLSRYHVGQFTHQWEVSYPIVNQVTKAVTGWTPALILVHLFAQLPDTITDRLKLGDVAVLHDLSSVTTPDIMFRLTDYAGAINHLTALVGDVAFRERFAGNITYLDFYRINAPARSRSMVRHASWTDTSRANVQSSQGTHDTTNTVDRIIGHGGYRQFMVTARNYIPALEAISETTEAARLSDYWDATLEPLAMKNPELTTNGGKFSIKCIADADVTAETTTFDIEEPYGIIPIGSYISTGAGEVLKVTGFTAKVDADPPSVPDSTPATITVLRAQKVTDAEVIKKNESLQVRVPGLPFVFRRYKLPAAWNGCTIMRSGCHKDIKGNQYPQYQSFVYVAKDVLHTDDGYGKKWLEGVMPGSITEVVPNLVNVEFNVEKREITFGKATVTLLSRKVKRDEDGNAKLDSNGKEIIETLYRRTVCGVTATLENQRYPFGYDTGARPTTRFDFNDSGLTDRWQKDEFQFWQLGTGTMPINGVDFPCIHFPPESGTDSEGFPVDTQTAYYVAPGASYITRTDQVALRTLCEQTLREKNRRARSYSVVIPWFSPGYQVGQQIDIEGLDNLPRDIFKITSVEHSIPIEGTHQTTIQIDNIKPPVRHVVRTER